jgi:hypothetical protein
MRRPYLCQKRSRPDLRRVDAQLRFIRGWRHLGDDASENLTLPKFRLDREPYSNESSIRRAGMAAANGKSVRVIARGEMHKRLGSGRRIGRIDFGSQGYSSCPTSGELADRSRYVESGGASGYDAAG